MLTVGPEASSVLRRIDDRWISSRPLPAEARAADWIKRNTCVYDVFLCRPQTAYRPHPAVHPAASDATASSAETNVDGSTLTDWAALDRSPQ